MRFWELLKLSQQSFYLHLQLQSYRLCKVCKSFDRILVPIGMFLGTSWMDCKTIAIFWGMNQEVTDTNHNVSCKAIIKYTPHSREIQGRRFMMIFL